MKYLLFIFLFIISKYNFGQSPDYGLKVFKKANCNSCHQWHGDGGESYGGAAASIRETGLDKEGIQKIYHIRKNTYKYSDYFFSHRRAIHENKVMTGRMINIISFRD